MKSYSKAGRSAFSLIEVLMVIAIISVMSALAINAFTNATFDTNDTIARQQQATLQSAVNNWMSQNITGTMTVAAVKDLYNFKTGTTKRSSLERLTLVKDYLNQDTYDHFSSYTADAAKVRSSAMKKVKKYLVLTDWPDPSGGNTAPYPKVELNNE